MFLIERGRGEIQGIAHPSRPPEPEARYPEKGGLDGGGDTETFSRNTSWCSADAEEGKTGGAWPFSFLAGRLAREHVSIDEVSLNPRCLQVSSRDMFISERQTRQTKRKPPSWSSASLCLYGGDKLSPDRATPLSPTLASMQASALATNIPFFLD